MSDTNLGNYKGLRTASVKRSLLLCVVNPSDTTSYSSVKGHSSVHHVQRQTCVVTFDQNFFNSFNSSQTVTVRLKLCRRNITYTLFIAAGN